MKSNDKALYFFSFQPGTGTYNVAAGVVGMESKGNVFAFDLKSVSSCIQLGLLQNFKLICGKKGKTLLEQFGIN